MNAELPREFVQALSETPAVPRPAELRALREAAGRATEAGGLAVVSGEPGVGKTRLAAELAEQILGQGQLVLYGRCDPDAALPYGAFVQVLEAPQLRDEVLSLEADVQSRLSRLLPVVPAAAGEGEEAGRLQMFEAVLSALRQLGQVHPALVVIEDLHWAEPSTLALVRYLAGRLGGSGIALLSTLRKPDPDPHPAVDAMLEDLRQRGLLHEVSLPGLDREQVAALVSQWAQAPPPPTLAADLHSYSGGNPFYLRSTLTHLAALGELRDPEGQIRTGLRDAGGRLPVPEDVRELATTLVRRLGPQVGTLLQTGAVLGAEFALDEAIAACRFTPEEAVEAVDALTDSGLTRQYARAPIRVSFAHALIQQALRDAMTPSRRALINLRAAEAIEATGPASGRSRELASRFAEAMSLGTAAKALHYARQAAREAGRRYAFVEQADTLELALQAIEAGGAAQEWDEYDVLMELGTARYRATELERSQAAFARAAELAERRGDRERVGRAALGVGLERYLHRIGEADAALIELLERGLREMDRRADRLAIRLSTALVLERCFVDPHEQLRARIDEVIDRAQSLEDLDAELEGHAVRQQVLWFPSRTEELLARLPQLTALAHARGRPELAMHIYSAGVGHALELGRRSEMEDALAGASAVAEQMRSPIQHVRLAALRILVALVDGRLEEARAQIGATLPVMYEIEPQTAMQLGLLWEIMLARQVGRLAEMRPQLEAFVAAAPGIPLARALLGEACAEGGDLAAARLQLEALASGGFADVHEDFVWLAVLGSAARIAAALEDRAQAERLQALLEPYADRNCLSGVATASPPVAYTLGLLATALREPERAVMWLTEARERARDFGALPWEAQAALALGRVLRRTGSRRAAREPLAQALRLAESYGADALAAQAREELLAVGGRPLRRAEAPTLTQSELRVARLAAQGMTNEQIAQAIFVTRRTVETHLTHAYAKLGISSRSDLARALAGHEVSE